MVTGLQAKLVATVLGPIPASFDTVESEGQQMKQSRIQYIAKKNLKNPPVLVFTLLIGISTQVWRN
jgi:hypothetical protein